MDETPHRHLAVFDEISGFLEDTEAALNLTLPPTAQPTASLPSQAGSSPAQPDRTTLVKLLRAMSDAVGQQQRQGSCGRRSPKVCAWTHYSCIQTMKKICYDMGTAQQVVGQRCCALRATAVLRGPTVCGRC